MIGITDRTANASAMEEAPKQATATAMEEDGDGRKRKKKSHHPRDRVLDSSETETDDGDFYPEPSAKVKAVESSSQPKRKGRPRKDRPAEQPVVVPAVPVLALPPPVLAPPSAPAPAPVPTTQPLPPLPPHLADCIWVRVMSMERELLALKRRYAALENAFVASAADNASLSDQLEVAQARTAELAALCTASYCVAPAQK